MKPATGTYSPGYEDRQARFTQEHSFGWIPFAEAVLCVKSIEGPFEFDIDVVPIEDGSDGISGRTTRARETAMIKDIVVNLSLRDSHDVTMDFAISAAAMFEAHLAAVGFVYEPLIPVMIDMYGVPSEMIESQRIENERAAKAAVDSFDAAVRRTAVSALARTVDAPVDTAPRLFAQIARRFDLSVVAQPEPERARARPDDCRGGALQQRATSSRRALRPKSRSHARSRHAVLGRKPQCRPRRG